jgi:thiol-disulfide isomerase/thioredoxin
MMIKRLTLYLVLLYVCCSSAFGTSISQEFMAKLQSATSEQQALILIKDYIGKTTDIEELRLIQNPWLTIDPLGCEAHFADLHKGNPNSLTYHYLWARALQDPLKSLEEGRKIIRKHPKSVWGYRLVNAFYSQGLFTPVDGYNVDQDKLIESLAKDRTLILDSHKRFPKDSFSLSNAVNLYRYEKKYGEAEKLLLNAELEALDFLSPNFMIDFSLETNSLRVFEKHFRLVISGLVNSGRIAESETEETYIQYYLHLLQRLGDWDTFDAYFAKNPSELDNRDRYFNLITYNIAKNNNDRALDYLATLLREDRISLKTLESNREWQALASGDKYMKLMYEAQLKWDNEAPLRRRQALSKQINTPAPEWELPDAQGKSVRLSDLRGQVLVLDFWATWCDPCKQVMPILHEWNQKTKPAGVSVFSINVWERNPELAIDFMASRGYSMKLLIGTNELARDYRIDGIPFICVIDKKGNIRFFESGFSEDLAEKLGFWTDALLAE